MKTMTCNQLGGACDLEFSADTFDEIAAKSQQHGKEMFGTNDSAQKVDIWVHREFNI